MVLPTIFQRFVEGAPLCVMARALLERSLQAADLDDLFKRLATVQYTRELTFSAVVDLLSQVAFRNYRSVNHAYPEQADRRGVSLTAVHDKLNHLEPQFGPALVRHSACQMQQVITALDADLPPWRAGFHVKIIDGNHFSGTQHRLKVLRGTAAAPLPGQVLAVLDPRTRLFLDLIPCEDAYTQERVLLGEVLPLVQANDVWVGDRNLCTPKFLTGSARRQAFFAIREHAQLNIHYVGAPEPAGRCATGLLYEQQAWVSDDEGGLSIKVRRVVVKLDKPTRDGDVEVSVLTNLPAAVADAAAVADLYLGRWTIEVAFGELTTALRCEVETLGYPRAALFCFAVAVLAANVLGAVRAALRAAHGTQRVEEELSVPKVALEIAGKYQGMMVALPEDEWQVFARMSPAEFARTLRDLARQVKWERFEKSKRGPKKPPPQKPSASKNRHVSTARLLQQQQKRSVM